MLYLDKNTPIPSIDYALSVFNLHKSKCPTFIDYDKLMSYWTYYVQMIKKIQEELDELFEYVDNGGSTRTQWYKYVMGRSSYARHLPKTDGGATSFSREAIEELLENHELDDKSETQLKKYLEWNRCKYMKSSLDKLVVLPVSKSYSYDGHRMVFVRPEFWAQNTLRIGMREPAIQNFARVIQDLVTVPKGYILIHCDSSQVEPRIIYSTFFDLAQIKHLINLYGDAYFGVLHYAMYLTDEEIASGTLDIKPLEITDEMKNNIRPEIKKFNNETMYGSKSNPKNSKAKAALIKRIGEHPFRLGKLKEYEKQIIAGDFIFKTYFGTPINILNSEKLKGVKKGSEEFVYQCLKLAINNPIQGTAADLMRYSVSQADRLIREKAKDSYIIDYVHDSGRFCVSEKDYDKVGDELSTIVGYNVDGWIPIPVDGEIGRCAGMYKDLF